LGKLKQPYSILSKLWQLHSDYGGKSEQFYSKLVTLETNSFDEISNQ